jgi:chromosomal replication initiator protein
VNTKSLICLYGPSASGKTRLLQAMERALADEGVLLAGAEAIVWEMTDSFRYAAMDAFRQKYLEVENLLIDNLWVLDNKPVTAGEICRLLRERQETGKLTVVASDIPEQEWNARNSSVAQLLACGQRVQLGCNQRFKNFSPQIYVLA